MPRREVDIYEQLYYFFNFAARWGGWSMPRSCRFTPGKYLVPTVQEGGQSLGSVWTGEEKLRPPSAGFDSREFQPVASRCTDYCVYTHSTQYVCTGVYKGLTPFAITKKASDSSETYLNIYQTKRRHILEDASSCYFLVIFRIFCKNCAKPQDVIVRVTLSNQSCVSDCQPLRSYERFSVSWYSTMPQGTRSYEPHSRLFLPIANTTPQYLVFDLISRSLLRGIRHQPPGLLWSYEEHCPSAKMADKRRNLGTNHQVP